MDNVFDGFSGHLGHPRASHHVIDISQSIDSLLDGHQRPITGEQQFIEQIGLLKRDQGLVSPPGPKRHG